MKNKALFIVCIFFLFIGITKADNCTVISGTGKDLGDEIKCGTESFYVVDRNENTTKMLAKYNLYVGDIIDFIEVDDPNLKDISELEFHSLAFEESAREYCINYAKSKGYNPYYAVVYSTPNNTTPTEETFDVSGCRIYEKINYEHVRQDAKAIGTTFKSDGVSYYPQVGITYMNELWGYDYIHDNIEYVNKYNGPISLTEYCEDETTDHSACYFYTSDPDQSVYGDLILKGSSFEKYINGYKDELTKQNINFKDVDFLHLSGFREIYKKIANEDIYLKFNYDGYGSYEQEKIDYNASAKLPLKDKIPNKYKWLYGTTYWLGSGSLWNMEIQESDYNVSEYNDYYFTTEGILCSLGRGICTYSTIPIGGGIRPVLTINNEYIMQAKQEETKKEDKEEKVNPKTADLAIVMMFVVFVLSLIIVIVNERKLRRIR